MLGSADGCSQSTNRRDGEGSRLPRNEPPRKSTLSVDVGGTSVSVPLMLTGAFSGPVKEGKSSLRMMVVGPATVCSKVEWSLREASI